jgi:antitoxin ParD1/3/4
MVPMHDGRPDEVDDELYDAAERRAGAAHAAALKEQAEAGGLRFEAYLPSDLAVWLLASIARGDFMDPSEAVFVMLGEQQDLAAYPDLRRELLRRTIEDAANDPHPGFSAEEVFTRIRAKLATPRPPAAVWDPSVTRRAAAKSAESSHDEPS